MYLCHLLHVQHAALYLALCACSISVLFAVPFLHGGVLCRVFVDISVSPSLIAWFFESYFEKTMVPEGKLEGMA